MPFVGKGTTVVNDGGTTGVSASSVNSGNTLASSGSGYGSNSSSGIGNWFGQLQQLRDYNNDWNSAQVAAMNSFNSHEAQKNRDWQERMFKNYHQYEVQDLLAAGLNPVLSAGGSPNIGSGASASGGKATADDTLSNGLISLMAAMISASSASTVANIYTQNQRYMAENYPSNWVQLANALLSSNDGSGSGIANTKKALSKIGKEGLYPNTTKAIYKLFGK